MGPYTILLVVSSVVCAWSIILFIRIIRPCFFKNAAAPNTPMNNANEPVGRRTRFINHTHAVYIRIYGRRRVLTAAAGPKFCLIIYTYYVCVSVCVYSFYYILVFILPARPHHLSSDSLRNNHLPSRYIYIYIHILRI